MRSNTITRENFLVAGLFLFVAGCGGGKTEESGGTGRVRILVEWPALGRATSRYIPTYAKSLVFELYREGDPEHRVTLLANRPDTLPATQTIEFNQVLATGTYVLAGVARVEKDGLGSTVASALTNVIVAAFKTAEVDITLASTLRTITILGTPLQVPQGGTLNLSGEARDPEGKLVLLPPAALTWSVVSGASLGSVTPGGQFNATTAGTVRVRLAEAGAGVTGEADVVVIGASALATSAAPKDRGDVQNRGRSSGSGATGVQSWQRALGGGAIKSTAVVGLDNALYIAPTGNSFQKLHPSGSTIWSAPLGQAFRGTPAIGSNGLIYVPSTTGLQALDIANGSTRWTFGAGIRLDGSPTIGSDKTVYFSFGNRLTALDGETGAKKWEFFSAGGGSGCPALDGLGTLYFATDSGRVYALDTATGAKKWEFRTPGTEFILSSVAVENGTVYFGSFDHKFYALNAATGAKKWEFDAGDELSGSPVIGLDGTVYFATTGIFVAKVFALDGTTGAKKWEYQRHPSNSAVFLGSSVIGGDGTLYLTSTWGGGTLHAIDSANGTLKWEFALSAFSYCTPTVAGDGTVYLGDEKGQFFAVH
ncbi:PQQ-binding-like beta-propeller repeat protein [Armatimonas sp.]|uniref:outer membrane protein assembly factor BamB family protein n=1 Tax=Armatimonas sp. TaxID=1872638 RepID=UPI00375340B9